MESKKQRKHRTQMRLDEIAVCERMVRDVETWDMSNPYVIARMQQREITPEGIEDALKRGDLIEVNSLGRIVVRSRRGTCVVVDLAARCLVTVWYNAPEDTHKTLRRNEYKWRVNVTSYLNEILAGVA